MKTERILYMGTTNITTSDVFAASSFPRILITIGIPMKAKFPLKDPWTKVPITALFLNKNSAPIQTAKKLNEVAATIKKMNFKSIISWKSVLAVERNKYAVMAAI